MQRTQIVLLGTGNPNADPFRSGPSVAVVVNNAPYLVDFGPGVVRRAAAARLKGVNALAVQNLTRAFVTHLHSDHTVGYADLIFTPWVLGRTEPLEVYGPPGLRSMTNHILAAYNEDIQIRLHGLEHAHPRGYQVRAHEIKPGVIYRDDNVKVRAFRVPHGSWPHAYGYRFETADRTIVISGDTVPHPNIAKYSRGCDVLIHEVFSQAGLEEIPAAWRKYHTRFHTSSVALARIAKKSKPALLVLYHQLFFGSMEDELLDEIRRIYDGPVVSGHDLDVY
jgi:ribonuclease BN (tRNA processing enzyme)